MSYKFDGKAGERAANAIISLCKDQEHKHTIELIDS